MFPAGETTFIVGSSGSGKSTLGNLLLRFYEASYGNILIDGNPIQNLDINWVRNNITLAQQQSVLFNDTLFKTIALGCKNHSTVKKGDVLESITTASLQDMIESLPLGLDTVVGNGGNAMSGGQKQRVAIARARLKDAPILILDEATSALDQISKSRVMRAIREWRSNKTTIIITHDMALVEAGDYAYVLQDGIIVQEGFRANLEKLEVGPFQPLSPPLVKPTVTPKSLAIEGRISACTPNNTMSTTAMSFGALTGGLIPSRNTLQNSILSPKLLSPGL